MSRQPVTMYPTTLSVLSPSVCNMCNTQFCTTPPDILSGRILVGWPIKIPNLLGLMVHPSRPKSSIQNLWCFAEKFYVCLNLWCSIYHGRYIKHHNFGSKYWGEGVNCKHALAERQNLEFGFQTPQKNRVRLVRFQLVLCCFCLSHIPNSASQYVCTRLVCVWSIEDCAICAGLLSREVTWPLRGFVRKR